MEVMIINGNRYLINSESPGCDNICDTIINSYPDDSIIEFEKPIINIDYRP